MNRWSIAAVPGAVAPVMLAFALGLGVAPQRLLPDLPRAATADYDSRFTTGFASLREGYVRDVLGEAPASDKAPAPNADVAADVAAGVPRDGVSGRDDGVDPLPGLPVGSNRPISPQPGDTVGDLEVWRSKGASISTDGSIVAFASTDTRIPGMDSTPCQATPPGPTVVSVLWKVGRGDWTNPPPDPGPCDQVVVTNLRTGETTIASTGIHGELANSPVHALMLSGDGRYIAFATAASNLVANDHNDTSDVFVYDLRTGVTELISVSLDGRPFGRPWQDYPDQFGAPIQQPVPDALGSVGAEFGTISHDGRYVVFESSSDEIAPDDTPQSVDVFVRDRLRGITERISIPPGGAAVPAEDVQRDNAWRIQRGSLESAYPCMSLSGRFVVFRSQVSNLVPNDVNDGPDLFLHDRETGRTELVTVSTSGGQQDRDALPAVGRTTYPEAHKACVSDDGRYVLFESNSTNLVQRDTNGEWDIFLRDRTAGLTRRVSVMADGSEARTAVKAVLPGIEYAAGQAAALSPDGGFVAFTSWVNLTPDDPDPQTEFDRYVDGFPPRDGERPDLFMYDIATAELVRLDVRDRSPYSLSDDEVTDLSYGVPESPALSNGAAVVAFHTRLAYPYKLTGSVRVYRWRAS